MSVQSATNGGDGGSTTVAATFGVAVTSGNLVRGYVTWGGTTANLTSVTDGTNTYTIVNKVLLSANSQCVGSFYAENVAAGATTVTANFGTSVSWRGISVSEESGLATTSPLDGNAMQAQTAPGTGTDAITSGNGTTTQSGNLVTGNCIDTSTGTAVDAVGTGFTVREIQTTGTAQQKSEDRIFSSTGSVAATFTDASNGNFITGMMAFKAAGAPPQTEPPAGRKMFVLP